MNFSFNPSWRSIFGLHFHENASSICFSEVGETGVSGSLFLVFISFLFLRNFQFLEALTIETAKIGFLLSLFFCLFSGFCLQSLRDLEEIIFANQVFLFLFDHWQFIICM